MAYDHADLFLNEDLVGSVHQCGYRPRWAFNLSPIRRKYIGHPKMTPPRGSMEYPLMDGAAYETREEAVEAAAQKISRFLEALEDES